MLVPESQMGRFRPAVANLVSWCRPTGRLVGDVAAIDTCDFSVGTLPDCLSILHSSDAKHDLKSGEIAIEGHFTYSKYTSFVMRHRHIDIDSTEEDLVLTVGCVGTRPWCQLTAWAHSSQREYRPNYEEKVGEGYLVLRESDRVNHVGSLGTARQLSVSTKIRPSPGASSRYALEINCQEETP